MKIDEIKKFKRIRERFELGEWCYFDSGEPVVVGIYLNEAGGKVYQVDEKLRRFRVANDGGKYGDWQKET